MSDSPVVRLRILEVLVTQNLERIDDLEKDVMSLKAISWKAYGVITAIIFVATLASHFIEIFWKMNLSK